MVCSLNDLSSMGQDSLVPDLVASRKTPVARRVQLRQRAVAVGSLATVEIPLFALIVAIFGISVLVAPDSSIRGTGIHLPTVFCPFYVLTDFPCLFCGLTRSFLAMGGLDIRQAFIFHPLGPTLYLSMLAIGATLAWSMTSRHQVRFSVDAGLRKTLIRLGVGVVVLAWVVKVMVWSQAGLL